MYIHCAQSRRLVPSLRPLRIRDSKVYQNRFGQLKDQALADALNTFRLIGLLLSVIRVLRTGEPSTLWTLQSFSPVRLDQR